MGDTFRTPQEIFLRASQMTSKEEREAFLAEACSGDSTLRNKVDDLLRTLAAPSEMTVDSPPRGSAADQVGTMVGPYKLLQEIGEGGFGVVYMADQIDPVRRKVALKIVKPGMDTKDVLARFEAEQQALALMEHPNIAKVLDGGVTDLQRPYFVMELVKGVPINEFCDKNKLSTSQRIELFVTVCHAIDHAHKKGIIHRDIKPSNVMVTLHDGNPVPKVIDFGVSKALSQQLTEKTLFTAYGQMVGTPTYMSPEQAEMSGLDIDIRSDVYSLGVLLYELLTGTTPIGNAEVQSATYDELQRLIREEEAPRPSARLSTLGANATVNAKNRSTDTKKLTQLLRGDLDWIVIKALEKDRNRRYESARALAEDLLRYAEQKPVEARPPSVSYKTRKFLRRNRLQVGVVAVVGIVVVVTLSSGILLFEGKEKQDELQEQASELALAKAALESAADAQESARKQLAEVVAHKANSRLASAYKLLQELGEVLSDDPNYVALQQELLVPVDVVVRKGVVTKLEIRDWDDPDGEWVAVKIDKSGLVALPEGKIRVRAQAKGHATKELSVISPNDIVVPLSLVDTSTAGMIEVASSDPRGQKPNQPVADFLIGKFEVSNSEYQLFVDAGGYADKQYWNTKIVDLQGTELTFDDAMQKFVDSTGHQGPARWRDGKFPVGQGDYPVHSVSWYEASAYAKFAGQSLPTVSHWRWATRGPDEMIVPRSNFSTEKLAACGEYDGVGVLGLYDTAGNVGEWVANDFSETTHKCFMGASWKDPIYQFRNVQNAHPFSRLDSIGFRCIQIKGVPDEKLYEAARDKVFAVDSERISDELFAAYKSMYSYDKGIHLNSEVVTRDLGEGKGYYREEQVIVQAAYGDERMNLYLLFPRAKRNQYHVLIWVPGAGATRLDRFDSSAPTADAKYLRTLAKTGRLVVTASYKGMYDRRDVSRDGINQRRDWRIMIAKDVSRIIDYLETRSDVKLGTLAYSGLSLGAFTGISSLALDNRFAAAVLFGGGAIWWDEKPEVNPSVLAPFINVPLLMLNGRYDNIFPLTPSAEPLFELFGSEDKHLEVYEAGHLPPIESSVEFSDEWLRKRFGEP